MNFIDYCIATKNFSALDAVEDYTKSFGYLSEVKNLLKGKNVSGKDAVSGSLWDRIKRVAGHTGKTLRNKVDNYAMKKSGLTKNDINNLRKQGGYGTLDLLRLKKGGIANNKEAGDVITGANKAAAFLNRMRKDDKFKEAYKGSSFGDNGKAFEKEIDEAKDSLKKVLNKNRNKELTDQDIRRAELLTQGPNNDDEARSHWRAKADFARGKDATAKQKYSEGFDDRLRRGGVDLDEFYGR